MVLSRAGQSGTSTVRTLLSVPGQPGDGGGRHGVSVKTVNSYGQPWDLPVFQVSGKELE